MLHADDQRHDRLVERRRHAVLGTEAHDPAVEGLDLGAAVGESVLEHGRAVVVGDLRGVVDQLLGARSRG